MKYIFLILSFFIAAQLLSQARMVINNNASIVMNGGVNIVIDNNNANAILTTGTGGNIISEKENNYIQWNIQSSTGSYIIPFTTASGIKIPLQINIATAGTGPGKISASTYPCATWNNDLYRPAGVTNMTNISTLNNSAEVIDRFWIMDAQGYTTKPSGDMQFNYDDAEHLASGNTITESDLKAERYDPVAGSWETYPVSGTINTSSNNLGGVLFSAADLTRSWSLIDQVTHLLPVVLTEFTAACFSGNAIISWQTAQEINTNAFILEGSTQGDAFTYITTLGASGYSTSATNYSYAVENNELTYYRLRLVNTDGSEDTLGVTSMNCGSSSAPYVNAYASGMQQIIMQTTGLMRGNYHLHIYDITGKLVLRSELTLDELYAQYIIEDRRLAAGLYVLQLTGAGNIFSYSKTIQVL